MPETQPEATEQRPTNHLAGESSPYLLQHVHNPVDWYPWGEEALQRAKAEDKPIFLSVGYSACHWCHVMERESFEDPEIAAILNADFISIKVDREERPDLDDMYMQAVQAMTGSGGWPMTVFLTPDLKPFFGGTYFPPQPAHGRPSFRQILEHLSKAWKERRQEIDEYADRVDGTLAAELPEVEASPLPQGDALPARLQGWIAPLQSSFDSVWGGFGSAPKFPRAEDLRWLLAVSAHDGNAQALNMAVLTLKRMAAGGIYDQLAGGFARYSTDEKWLIPHFEKMLYDQGCLLPAYLDAWRLTGDPYFAQVVRESCDYLLREMQDPGGAFWSSTDADSEGEEGKFFVWTPQELQQVLGSQKGRFASLYFGVTPLGNFEHGRSALHLAMDAQQAARDAGLENEDLNQVLAEIKTKLYETRSKRIPPGTDDKILVGWNGLVIDALAYAGRALGEPRYLQAAERAADFLLNHMVREDGGMWRSWRKGKAAHRAVLEDHAYFMRALLSLFQSSGEERWLLAAEQQASWLLENFWDEEEALFWDTDGQDPYLRHRRKSPTDGATPSANGVALEALLHLSWFSGEDRWGQMAERSLEHLLPLFERAPRAFSTTMRVLLQAAEEPAVALLIGNGEATSLEKWRQAVYAPKAPWVLPVFKLEAEPESEIGLFRYRVAGEGQSTLYLCRGKTCLEPSIKPEEFSTLAAKKF